MVVLIVVIAILHLFSEQSAFAIEEHRSVIFHKNVTGNGDGALIPVNGYNTLGVDIEISGGATVSFLGRSSANQGVSFKPISCLKDADSSSVQSITSSGSYKCALAGIVEIKLPVSSCSGCDVTVAGTVTTATLNGHAAVSLATLLACENQLLHQCYTSDSGFPIRYTTTGDKTVKATAGEVVQVSASSGTNVTVAFYDDADGTCSSNQVLGTTPLTNGVPFKFPARFAVGICMVVGGTSPDLTVVYK